MRISNGLITIEMSLVNPEEWEMVRNIETIFLTQFKSLFKDFIFEAHRYLIRTTPLRTGRLRSGWSAVLNKYNQDYTAALQDTSLTNNDTSKMDVNNQVLGQSESAFIDEDLDVSVINNVPYGEYVEFGTSKMAGANFTTRALYKSELIFGIAFDKWLEEAGFSLEVQPDTVESMTI